MSSLSMSGLLWTCLVTNVLRRIVLIYSTRQWFPNASSPRIPIMILATDLVGR